MLLVLLLFFQIAVANATNDGATNPGRFVYLAQPTPEFYNYGRYPQPYDQNARVRNGYSATPQPYVVTPRATLATAVPAQAQPYSPARYDQSYQATPYRARSPLQTQIQGGGYVESQQYNRHSIQPAAQAQTTPHHYLQAQNGENPNTCRAVATISNCEMIHGFRGGLAGPMVMPPISGIRADQAKLTKVELLYDSYIDRYSAPVRDCGGPNNPYFKINFGGAYHLEILVSSSRFCNAETGAYTRLQTFERQLRDYLDAEHLTLEMLGLGQVAHTSYPYYPRSPHEADSIDAALKRLPYKALSIAVRHFPKEDLEITCPESGSDTDALWATVCRESKEW